MEDDTPDTDGALGAADQSAGFAVGPKADQFADWEAQKADLARRATAQRLQQFNDAKGYIERAYRGPSTSEQLMAISQALLAPRRYRGFAGTMSKLSSGFGGIQEAQRKAEQQRAQALMQLQQQYQTRELDAEDKGLDTQLEVIKARLAANKPRIPRAVGTQVVNGKVVAVTQNPDTGEISTTEIGEAPANLKPIPGTTSGGQPVFMGARGPVDATGRPITQFDVKPKNVSATEQKQIFESEDTITSGLGTVKSLEEALNLNSQAYEGSLSGWRKTLGQVFSSDDPQYVATENFDNLVMGGALQSMKSIFGANPTEGERKILLELQAISSKPRQVREEILRRALAATKTRLARETSRLRGLKGGDYSSRGGSTVGKTRVIRYDKNGKRI